MAKKCQLLTCFVPRKYFAIHDSLQKVKPLVMLHFKVTKERHSLSTNTPTQIPFPNTHIQAKIDFLNITSFMLKTDIWWSSNPVCLLRNC